jgi:hypothetical protein
MSLKIEASTESEIWDFHKNPCQLFMSSVPLRRVNFSTVTVCKLIMIQHSQTYKNILTFNQPNLKLTNRMYYWVLNMYQRNISSKSVTLSLFIQI